MGSIIYLDIAGLIQLCSVFYHQKKKTDFDTRKQIDFSFIFQAILLALVLEIFLVFVNKEHFLALPLCYLFASLKWVSHLGVYFLYLRILLMQGEKDKKEEPVSYKITTLVPFLIGALVCCTSFITKLIFYYDEAGNYVQGKASFIIDLLIVYTFVVAIYRTIRYRMEMGRQQREVAIFYCATILISHVLKNLFPDLLLDLFATEVAAVMMYFTLVDPGKYLNKELQILNRAAFDETVIGEFSVKAKFQVFAIQLTGMFFIADYLGANRAEQLRKTVADKFREIVVNNHPIYYIGQDRFAIIANEDWKVWSQYISEIEKIFSQRFLVEGMQLEIHASKCMISCPEYAKNLQELMDMIMMSLSESAKLGKRDVVYPSEEYIKKGQRERDIILLLQKAIQEEGMEVFYQPVLNRETGKYDSAKALLRMKDQSMGEIGPAEFIPIAEKSGFMVDIEKFVLRETCRMISEQHLDELGLEKIYVDLSSLSCLQEDLAEHISEYLKDYPLGNVKLGFEVSEEIANSAGTIFERNMKAIQDMGVFLTLDAIKYGYADVQLLQKYKFDTIKLSRTFVWKMLKEKQSMDALVHIMRLLHQFDCKVIAEGIESQDQEVYFKKLDADYMQGFFFSKPIPAGEWAEFMKNKNFKGEK